MMNLQRIVVGASLALVAACGQLDDGAGVSGDTVCDTGVSEGNSSDGGTADSGVPEGPATSFTLHETAELGFEVRTINAGRSIGGGMANYIQFVTLTDGAGLIACTLSYRDSVTQANATALSFGYGLSSFEGCEEGLEIIRDCGRYFHNSGNCAGITSWDESGNLVSEIGASGGVVEIARVDDGCRITMEILFDDPANPMNLSFTLPDQTTDDCYQ